MQAILMVGGRGVRLRPFTATIPKPLVPIGGECPIVEVLLRQLRRHGVTDVALAIGHLGEQIRSFVGDGSKFDLDVEYWEEQFPLGTAGPLIEHLDELPEHFLLLNGDLLCDLPFGDLVDFHRRCGADITVAASRQSHNVEFGVLDVVGTALQGFTEKPQHEYLVNMGVYVVSRSALSAFEPGRSLGADQVISRCIDAGTAHVFDFDGYWLDIGRPEDYDRANEEFADLRSRLLGERDPVIDLRSDEAMQRPNITAAAS